MTLSLATRWHQTQELFQTQRELRRYQTELEQLVALRTADLEQEKLRAEGLLDTLIAEKSQSDRILGAIREGMVVVDRHGNIEQVNRRLEEMVGQPESMLIGQPLRAIFVVQQGGVIRALANQRLRQVREYLQSMLQGGRPLVEGLCEISLVATLVVDVDGAITECNTAMEELSGWRASDLIGSGVEGLMPEPFRAGHAELVSRFFQQHEAGTMGNGRSLPLLRRSGEVVEVEIGLLPLEMEGGRQVLVIFHDPKEEQQWELFLMTPFGRLFVEQEVGEGQSYLDWELQHEDGRTTPVHVSGAPLYRNEEMGRRFSGAVLVLHNLELLMSAESARQANKAKDEFLATMSHELRTPLSSIIGNCDLLLEGSVTPRQREQLQTIRVAGQVQLALINDILDLSRIESGKINIEQSPYALSQMVEELFQICMARVVSAEVEFRWQLEGEERWQLLGDRRRIGQILLNLLSNAIKFTEKGSVVLTVRLAEQLHFIVEDTGIGVSAMEIDRLFQPFEQADRSISRRFGGSGLGLYISRTLAQRMGGDILVESQVGRGSRFELRLPLQVSEYPLPQRLSPQQEQTREQESGSGVQFSGRVLVVEDTPELQRLLQQMLERLGIEVVIASNGQEGIDQAWAQTFGLLLMDMQMPVMDGIEATQRLRDQGYQGPIVALTANVMPRHREMFNRAGGDGFLTKPVDRRALLETLDQYLSRRLEEEKVPSTRDHAVPLTELELGDELMALFYERMADLYRQLVSAFESREWDDIRKVVHVIKGSGSSFGYPQLTQLGREIQERIDGGEREEVEPQLQQLLELIGTLQQRSG